MKSQSFHLILHNKAAERADLQEAIESLRGEGVDLDVHVTRGPGDAEKLAEKWSGSGADTVIAGGGDGTLKEVVQGIWNSGAEPRPSLGILPLGTANDFATAAEIPPDPREALAIAVATEAVEVDLGQVNEEFFLNMVTGGYGAEVTHETPEEMKNLLGRAAYLLTGVTSFGNLRACCASVRGGDVDWEGEFLVLAVGNGRQAGGGHLLCPEAAIDDGRLDLKILPAPVEGQRAETVRSLLAAGFTEQDEVIVSYRVETFVLESDEEIHVNVDGEPRAGRRFEFSIHPRALRLHLAGSSPLLGNRD